MRLGLGVIGLGVRTLHGGVPEQAVPVQVRMEGRGRLVAVGVRIRVGVGVRVRAPGSTGSTNARALDSTR